MMHNFIKYYKLLKYTDSRIIYINKSRKRMSANQQEQKYITYVGDVVFERKTVVPEVYFTPDDIELLRSIIDPKELEKKLTPEQMSLLQKISRQFDAQFNFVRAYDNDNPSELRKAICNCIEMGTSIGGTLASIALTKEFSKPKECRYGGTFLV